MVNKKKILGIIPARGGSKGIRNKNMQLIGEKPMIQFTFEAAKTSRKLDFTILTSDNRDIIAFAKQFRIHAPFVRPPALAEDDTPMIEVINHALEWCRNEHSYLPEYFVVLAPTSPFRNAEDIDNAIIQIEKAKKESLISVCPVSQHPAECVTLGDDETLEFVRIKGMDLLHGRQQYRPFYFIDGAIYICKVSSFYEKYYPSGIIFDESSDIWIMEKQHSIDINDWFDLHLARALLHYDKHVESAKRD